MKAPVGGRGLQRTWKISHEKYWQAYGDGDCRHGPRTDGHRRIRQIGMLGQSLAALGAAADALRSGWPIGRPRTGPYARAAAAVGLGCFRRGFGRLIRLDFFGHHRGQRRHLARLTAGAYRRR